jgi:hypothetical protein
MMDFVNIGSAPYGEDCVQVGEEDYVRKSRIECRAFIKAIRKKLGPEVGTAKLCMKTFPHDFGNYVEVCCRYNGYDKEGEDYAFLCESSSPQTWEEVGMDKPDFKEERDDGDFEE